MAIEKRVNAACSFANGGKVKPGRAHSARLAANGACCDCRVSWTRMAFGGKSPEFSYVIGCRDRFHGFWNPRRLWNSSRRLCAYPAGSASGSQDHSQHRPRSASLTLLRPAAVALDPHISENRIAAGPLCSPFSADCFAASAASAAHASAVPAAASPAKSAAACAEPGAASFPAAAEAAAEAAAVADRA